MFKEGPKLTAAERALYARQISLAEIGEEGQARLCKLALRVPAGESEDTFAQYVSRAGVRVLPSGAVAFDRDVIADVPSPPSPTGLARLAGRSELYAAASCLHASFRAVEVLKAALGLGEPASIPASLCLSAAEAGEPSP